MWQVLQRRASARTAAPWRCKKVGSRCVAGACNRTTIARARGSGSSAWMAACSGASTWHVMQKSRAWHTAQLGATAAVVPRASAPCPSRVVNPGWRCEGGAGNAAMSARRSVVARTRVRWQVAHTVSGAVRCVTPGAWHPMQPSGVARRTDIQDPPAAIWQSRQESVVVPSAVRRVIRGTRSCTNFRLLGWGVVGGCQVTRGWIVPS